MKRLFRQATELGLIAAIALMVSACGKEPEAVVVTPTDLTPVTPESAPEVQEKARITQAVAIRDGVEPPAPTMTLRGGEVATPEVLAAYNQELLRYMVQRRDIPESIEDVKRIKTLPRLPTPPAGQRIAYDGRNHIIFLESR